jgi:hypothetical protein
MNRKTSVFFIHGNKSKAATLERERKSEMLYSQEKKVGHFYFYIRATVVNFINPLAQCTNVLHHRVLCKTCMPLSFTNRIASSSTSAQTLEVSSYFFAKSAQIYV